MKTRLMKVISALLTLLMLFQTAEPALAWLTAEGSEADAPASAKELVLKDAQGNETRVDESWEETYPFGAFAFDMTAGSVDEGGDAVLTLYRAGGARGRATAYIEYQPLAVSNEDGTPYLGYALSGNDLTIDVEDPLPIARYQAVGKYPDPEPGAAVIRKGTDEEGYVLTLSETAERYLWQVLYEDKWVDIGGSDAIDLKLDAEYLGEYDFRCVYTVDGVRYCTASVKGVAYEKPEPEVLEEAPEDLELNPEPTFSYLPIAEDSDLYSGWVFPVTFADGEWRKEIRIHANTDDESEALEEGAAFRIAYTDGGEIYAGAETYLFHVKDMNESTPSTVGFTVEEITADKADGKVVLTVRREGGNERPVSVEYATYNGVAAAGRDYSAAKGTLMFYGNVRELSIEIELIDDRVANDVPRDLVVALHELKGDDKCELGVGSVKIQLTNSGTGTGDNLATEFFDPEAIDMTASVAESPTTANGGTLAAAGGQVELEVPEPVEIELVPIENDGLSTQSHDFGETARRLDFAGKGTWKEVSYEMEDSSKWKVSGSASYGGITKYSDNELIPNVGYVINPDWNIAWIGDTAWSKYGSGAVGFAGTGAQQFDMTDTTLEKEMGQKFSKYEFRGRMMFSHASTDGSYTEGYGGTWTVPFLKIGDTRYQPNTKIDGYPNNIVGTWRLAGATNWQVVGYFYSAKVKDWTWSLAVDYNYSGTLDPAKNTYDVKGGIEFKGVDDEEDKHVWHAQTLLSNTMIAIEGIELTRRTFRANAFTMDITTPNDDNNTPKGEGCAVIAEDKYDAYRPLFTLTDGGATDKNEVYVGSTIMIEPQAIPGMFVADVVVEYSGDNGATWSTFTKFQGSGSDNAYTVTLMGDKTPLTKNEIDNGFFRFRVVYARDNKITVDLSPSLPRNENGNIRDDPAAIEMLYNGYIDADGNPSDGGETHSFGDARIEFGYSVFDSQTRDYSRTLAIGEQAVNEEFVYDPHYGGYDDQSGVTYDDGYGHDKPIFDPGSDEYQTITIYPDSEYFTFEHKRNIQWICFNLPKEDLLIVNGAPYPGDAKIWLSDEDIKGNITILYYNDAYQGYVNPMTTAISWKGIYLDGDGDRVITGTYDSDGLFTVTDPDDEFICFIDDGDSYNELEFEPIDLGNGKFAQYFVLVCYTMTPRRLTPLPEEEGMYAQVLPAFTSAMDPGYPAYWEQTSEQMMYTYIESGKDASGHYTSDDHIMFTPAANKKAILSIPLGGDRAPAHLNEAGDAYDWTPNWFDNYLIPWEHPELITITNSLAGPTQVTTEVEFNEENARYDYTSKGLRQINGYLASFSGVTTFLLISTIQQATTAEYVAARDADLTTQGDKNDPPPPDPNSNTKGDLTTVPDATYLKVVQDRKSAEIDISSTGTKKKDDEFPELSEMFFTNLGSNSIGVTDWVSVIVDENRVGFAISIPISSWEMDQNKKMKWKGPNKNYVEGLSDFCENDSGNLGDESLQKTRARQQQLRNSSSPSTGIPRVRALSSLLPAFSPATT